MVAKGVLLTVINPQGVENWSPDVRRHGESNIKLVRLSQTPLFTGPLSQRF